MRQFVTQGIVLSRTNYGEADRIITFLTPDYGKLKAYAKGVRKSKSKLAGGIELFSVSSITLIEGRGEIRTLISSRLLKHYGNIVSDIDRTNTAYDAIKVINKSTEDAPEKGYFDLLDSTFAALDDIALKPSLVWLWCQMQLLKLSGHAPNLRTDTAGKALNEMTAYNFYPEEMRFSPRQAQDGQFTAKHIKFLRLGFAARHPNLLNRVKGVGQLSDESGPLVQAMLKSFVRI